MRLSSTPETTLFVYWHTAPGGPVNRVFYYAIPPSVFATVSVIIKAAGQTSTGWNRVVVEKPFGTDLASSKVRIVVAIIVIAQLANAHSFSSLTSYCWPHTTTTTTTRC